MTQRVWTNVRSGSDSDSAKARLQRRIGDTIAEASPQIPWQNGEFCPDLALLGRLLKLTDPKNTTGASVATAVDMWVAEQFRAAGFEYVLPRRTPPYYVGATAASLNEGGQFAALEKGLSAIGHSVDALSRVAETTSDRSAKREIRRQVAGLNIARRSFSSSVRQIRDHVECSRASVLGEGRRKRIDVFVAQWDRGLELAVSTKTLALGVQKESELVKNIPNRWGEFDGDLKNLRGRFPLAAIGALLVVSEVMVKSNSILGVTDMMRKLTAPGRDWVNAYDATAVVVVENWSCDQEEHVRILAENDLPEHFPDDLLVKYFFNRLISRVLDRSPVYEHTKARRLRADSQGESGAAYAAAAQAIQNAGHTPHDVNG